MHILAIETSCDETSIAVLRDDREILSNLISSQIKDHAVFGGVVPEIASRKHLEAINHLLEASLKEAGVRVNDIDLICVTRGPGLVGALLVGISAAKAISYIRDIPIVAVNHMQGHICANYLAHPELKPPFLSLVVSGGHTYLCKIKDYTEYELVGSTLDDAAGESFDKISRVLGLGYPGGPAIEKAAAGGRADAFDFPRAMQAEEDGYKFSFSGLKTAVINEINKIRSRGQEVPVKDVAASFQQAVIDALVFKSKKLIKENPQMKAFCLSGGVAANKALRQALEAICQEAGINFYVPPAILCTDNAAMIGAAGYHQYLKEGGSGLDFEVEPDLGLEGEE